MPPLYEYRCEKCGSKDSEIREVDKRNDEKICKSLLNQHSYDTDSPLVEGGKIYSAELCNGKMKLKIGNPSFRITI